MASPCFDMHAWALDMLSALGNRVPSENVVKFVMGWGNVEAGGAAQNKQCNQCDYNMLNMSAIKGNEPKGVVGFCVELSANAGVCRFDNAHDAAVATANLIKSGTYPYLYKALFTNDEKSLGLKGTMTSQIAADLARWSGNTPNYAQNILSSAGVANVNITNGNVFNPPGGVPDTSSGSLDWYRVARGAIGSIMILAGLSLLIKALTPSIASSVVGTAVKAVAK